MLALRNRLGTSAVVLRTASVNGLPTPSVRTVQAAAFTTLATNAKSIQSTTHTTLTTAPRNKWTITFPVRAASSSASSSKPPSSSSSSSTTAAKTPAAAASATPASASSSSALAPVTKRGKRQRPKKHTVPVKLNVTLDAARQLARKTNEENAVAARSRPLALVSEESQGEVDAPPATALSIVKSWQFPDYFDPRYEPPPADSFKKDAKFRFLLFDPTQVGKGSITDLNTIRLPLDEQSLKLWHQRYIYWISATCWKAQCTQDQTTKGICLTWMAHTLYTSEENFVKFVNESNDYLAWQDKARVDSYLKPKQFDPALEPDAMFPFDRKEAPNKYHPSFEPIAPSLWKEYNVTARDSEEYRAWFKQWLLDNPEIAQQREVYQRLVQKYVRPVWRARMRAESERMVSNERIRTELHERGSELIPDEDVPEVWLPEFIDEAEMKDSAEEEKEEIDAMKEEKKRGKVERARNENDEMEEEEDEEIDEEAEAKEDDEFAIEDEFNEAFEMEMDAQALLNMTPKERLAARKAQLADWENEYGVGSKRWIFEQSYHPLTEKLTQELYADPRRFGINNENTKDIREATAKWEAEYGSLTGRVSARAWSRVYKVLDKASKEGQAQAKRLAASELRTKPPQVTSEFKTKAAVAQARDVIELAQQHLEIHRALVHPPLVDPHQEINDEHIADDAEINQSLEIEDEITLAYLIQAIKTHPSTNFARKEKIISALRRRHASDSILRAHAVNVAPIERNEPSDKDKIQAYLRTRLDGGSESNLPSLREFLLELARDPDEVEKADQELEIQEMEAELDGHEEWTDKMFDEQEKEADELLKESDTVEDQPEIDLPNEIPEWNYPEQTLTESETEFMKSLESRTPKEIQLLEKIEEKVTLLENLEENSEDAKQVEKDLITLQKELSETSSSVENSEFPVLKEKDLPQANAIFANLANQLEPKGSIEEHTQIMLESLDQLRDLTGWKQPYDTEMDGTVRSDPALEEPKADAIEEVKEENFKEFEALMDETSSHGMAMRSTDQVSQQLASVWRHAQRIAESPIPSAIKLPPALQAQKDAWMKRRDAFKAKSETERESEAKSAVLKRFPGISNDSTFLKQQIRSYREEREREHWFACDSVNPAEDMPISELIIFIQKELKQYSNKMRVEYVKPISKKVSQLSSRLSVSLDQRAKDQAYVESFHSLVRSNVDSAVKAALGRYPVSKLVARAHLIDEKLRDEELSVLKKNLTPQQKWAQREHGRARKEWMKKSKEEQEKEIQDAWSKRQANESFLSKLQEQKELSGVGFELKDARNVTEHLLLESQQEEAKNESFKSNALTPTQQAELKGLEDEFAQETLLLEAFSTELDPNNILPVIKEESTGEASLLIANGKLMASNLARQVNDPIKVLEERDAREKFYLENPQEIQKEFEAKWKRMYAWKRSSPYLRLLHATQEGSLPSLPSTNESVKMKDGTVLSIHAIEELRSNDKRTLRDLVEWHQVIKESEKDEATGQADFIIPDIDEFHPDGLEQATDAEIEHAEDESLAKFMYDHPLYARSVLAEEREERLSKKRKNQEMENEFKTQFDTPAAAAASASSKKNVAVDDLLDEDATEEQKDALSAARKEDDDLPAEIDGDEVERVPELSEEEIEAKEARDEALDELEAQEDLERDRPDPITPDNEFSFLQRLKRNRSAGQAAPEFEVPTLSSFKLSEQRVEDGIDEDVDDEDEHGVLDEDKLEVDEDEDEEDDVYAQLEEVEEEMDIDDANDMEDPENDRVGTDQDIYAIKDEDASKLEAEALRVQRAMEVARTKNVNDLSEEDYDEMLEEGERLIIEDPTNGRQIDLEENDLHPYIPEHLHDFPLKFLDLETYRFLLKDPKRACTDIFEGLMAHIKEVRKHDYVPLEAWDAVPNNKSDAEFVAEEKAIEQALEKDTLDAPLTPEEQSKLDEFQSRLESDRRLKHTQWMEEQKKALTRPTEEDEIKDQIDLDDEQFAAITSKYGLSEKKLALTHDIEPRDVIVDHSGKVWAKKYTSEDWFRWLENYVPQDLRWEHTWYDEMFDVDGESALESHDIEFYDTDYEPDWLVQARLTYKEKYFEETYNLTEEEAGQMLPNPYIQPGVEETDPDTGFKHFLINDESQLYMPFRTDIRIPFEQRLAGSLSVNSALHHFELRKRPDDEIAHEISELKLAYAMQRKEDHERPHGRLRYIMQEMEKAKLRKMEPKKEEIEKRAIEIEKSKILLEAKSIQKENPKLVSSNPIQAPEKLVIPTNQTTPVPFSPSAAVNVGGASTTSGSIIDGATSIPTKIELERETSETLIDLPDKLVQKEVAKTAAIASVPRQEQLTNESFPLVEIGEGEIDEDLLHDIIMDQIEEYELIGLDKYGRVCTQAQIDLAPFHVLKKALARIGYLPNQFENYHLWSNRVLGGASDGLWNREAMIDLYMEKFSHAAMEQRRLDRSFHYDRFGEPLTLEVDREDDIDDEAYWAWKETQDEEEEELFENMTAEEIALWKSYHTDEGIVKWIAEGGLFKTQAAWIEETKRAAGGSAVSQEVLEDNLSDFPLLTGIDLSFEENDEHILKVEAERVETRFEELKMLQWKPELYVDFFRHDQPGEFTAEGRAWIEKHLLTIENPKDRIEFLKEMLTWKHIVGGETVGQDKWHLGTWVEEQLEHARGINAARIARGKAASASANVDKKQGDSVDDDAKEDSDKPKKKTKHVWEDDFDDIDEDEDGDAALDAKAEPEPEVKEDDSDDVDDFELDTPEQAAAKAAAELAGEEGGVELDLDDEDDLDESGEKKRGPIIGADGKVVPDFITEQTDDEGQLQRFRRLENGDLRPLTVEELAIYGPPRLTLDEEFALASVKKKAATFNPDEDNVEEPQEEVAEDLEVTEEGLEEGNPLAPEGGEEGEELDEPAEKPDSPEGGSGSAESGGVRDVEHPLLATWAKPSTLRHVKELPHMDPARYNEYQAMLNLKQKLYKVMSQ
jgi:hypothetical protein